MVLLQPFARRVFDSMLRRCTTLTPVSSSFEWHNFVDRSTPFTSSFVDTAASCRQRKSVVRLPSIYPKHISSANLWLPVDFTDGTTVLLSGGLVGFVALRCYAEECAISLSTQAQDHVWDLAEYKRVEPAHYPTGATSGEAGCERKYLSAYHPLVCARALSFA